MTSTAAVTIDTTTSPNADLTAKWGTGSSANTITTTNFLYEILH